MFRTAIEKLQEKIAEICWRVILWTGAKIQTNSSSLPDLCATDHATDADQYIDRLNELLINRSAKVREIAITAPYAGGKSSILKTYMRKFPYHVYTCISLSDFNDSQKNIDSESNINKIEKSVVQQILYRTSSESTPNSRFRRIFPKPFSYFDSITQAFALTIWVLAAIIAFNSQEWTLNAIENISKEIDFWNSDLWVASYLFSLPLLLLKDLIKCLGPVTLTKMNVFQTELAFDKERNDSVFNTYLEEIIYYFSVTKSDVVIFEDLDRLKESKIFVKLKELNKLINDSIDVQQNVRFIYAIKDELFTGKDRTKFFDSIIPIIPVSHRSNSYPQLRNLLENSKLLSGLEENFLRDISIYIDDMRMIKNIVAEYAIYKSTYEKNVNNLEWNKLFSFIVYKNLYCDDFAKLNNHEGILANLIDSIHSVRKSHIENPEKQRKAIQNELVRADQEIISTLRDLNAAYISLVIKQSGWPHHNGFPYVGGIPFTELSDNDSFDGLYQNSRNVSISNPTSGRQIDTNRPFRSWSNQMTPSYDERREFVDNKQSKIREMKNAEIRNLEQKQQSARNKSFKELISEQGINEIFKEENCEALKYLVEKGYLDENYHLYISHFREGQLSKSDMDFIMNVKNRVKLDTHQSLSNCEEIIKYFSQSDYASPAILNPDLINHLLDKNSIAALHDVIGSAIALDENSFEVLYDFLGSVNSINKFVTVLIESWADIWSDIVTSQQIANERKTEILLKLIVASNVTPPNKVAQFIGDQNISSQIPQDEEKAGIIYSKLTEMHVQFRLVPMDCEPEFMESILANELFAQKFENIANIFGVLCGKQFDKKINLKDIFNGGSKTVIAYVYKHINFFAALVSQQQILLHSDAEYISMLTDNSVNKTHKIEIIEKCNFELSSLSDADLSEDLVSNIFKNQRIKISWRNTLELLSFENRLDEFYSYLNLENVIDSLSKQDTSKLSIESTKKISEIILLNDINLHAFKSYLPLFSNCYDYTKFNEFSLDRLKIYLDLVDLDCTKSNYSSIHECDIVLARKFLEKNFKSFAAHDLLPEIYLDNEDVIALLQSHTLDIRDKQYLFDAKKNDIVLTSDIIESIVPTLIEPGLSNIPRLTTPLITKLLSLIPGERERVLCLVGQLENVEKNSIWPLLELLGYEFKQLSQSKGSSYLTSTDYSLTLIALLKSRDIISSYSSVERKGKPLIKVNLKRN